MATTFDSELASELPCPIFNSYPTVTCNISLLRPTVYSPRFPRSADLVECVCLVSSLIPSSWCWREGGGWGVAREWGRMMIRAAGALFFWSHITVQQTCVRTAAVLRYAQRPASIKRAIHLSGAVTPTPHLFLLPVYLTAGCTGQPGLRSCQPHCNWDEWESLSPHTHLKKNWQLLTNKY